MELGHHPAPDTPLGVWPKGQVACSASPGCVSSRAGLLGDRPGRERDVFTRLHILCLRVGVVILCEGGRSECAVARIRPRVLMPHAPDISSGKCFLRALRYCLPVKESCCLH